MFDPESLKKIYKLFRWPEDLSKEGKGGMREPSRSSVR